MRKIEEETQILTEILKLLLTQVLKKVATAVTAHCTKKRVTHAFNNRNFCTRL